MAERSLKNEKDISTTPGRKEEAELILAIRKAEDRCPSAGKSTGQVSHDDHHLAQDYAAQPVNEFDLSAWLLPTLDLEQYEPDVEQETAVSDEVKGSMRYGWIGAGRCGAKLVESLYDVGYRKALAVDTTRHDLDLLDIPRDQKFLMDIGEEGTDRDMKRGARAIQEHQQDILHRARKIFSTQVDHIMICFGAGGGTGSGSVSTLIEIAKKYARYIGLENPDKNVGVIMTLPAAGKVGSPAVTQNACKVANMLGQMATAGQISPLIIVDNDKINKMFPGLGISSFWTSINTTVARLFDTFNRLSALSSPYTSFDPLDYRNIMKCGGCLTMGLTKVSKFDDTFAISEAIERNLKKTLFAGGLDLSTAKVCGAIVIGGKELMANVRGLQEHIDYAFDVLSEITGQATTHRGIYEDERDSLRVYTIIAGLDSPTDRLEELRTGPYFRPNNLDIKDRPPRQQKEDILSLAEHFLAKYARSRGRDNKILSSDAKKVLLNYSWRGNLRELAKAMERAHELTIGREIQPEALPFKIIFSDPEHYPKHLLPVLDEAKRTLITKALKLTQCEQTVTKILGIEVQHLNHLIDRLNISVPRKNTSS
jgi:cell division GTPase FtsZ